MPTGIRNAGTDGSAEMEQVMTEATLWRPEPGPYDFVGCGSP